MSASSGATSDRLRWFASRLAVVGGVVVAALVAAGGVTWTLLTPPQFTATSVVSLRPDPRAEFSADILLITAHEYVAYVSSPQVMEVAAKRSGKGVDELSGSTDVLVEAGTANVRIDVTLPTSAAAVSAANELAGAAAAEGRADSLVQLKVVSLATVQSTDITPPRRLLLAITCVLSALIGCLVYYVASRPGRPAAHLGHYR